MITSPSPLFAAHECSQAASKALRMLDENHGIEGKLLFGNEKAPMGAILIFSKHLEYCPGKYLRILPRIPNPNRTFDFPLYREAEKFGWHTGAGGLVIVNMRHVGPSGFFEAPAGVDSRENHYAQFRAALTGLVATFLPRAPRPKRSHRPTPAETSTPAWLRERYLGL